MSNTSSAAAGGTTSGPQEQEEPIVNVFETKYGEFVTDLQGTFPELSAALGTAGSLSPAERLKEYYKTVMKAHARPKTEGELPCPGPVLPGVTLTEDLWGSVGEQTKKAVYDYLSILDLCALYEVGFGGDGGEGGEAFEGFEGFSKEWADKVMRDWRGKLDRFDFKNITDKFANLFGGASGTLPQLPEKFLKGKLAKLAEDMVREFKPEDFGLRPEDIESVEKDPTRAFEILMGASASNPGMIQKAIARVGKKLQEKVQRGELRPQELVAEAEELMKEFQTHPAFVEMMESFRSAFSFEDTDTARAAGRDGENRLSIARARLRKKLEAKRGGKK